MTDKTTVEIYTATHKRMDFTIPAYCRRLQVNCKVTGSKWDQYIHDDDGINISEKNASYCELTALYWGWKNSEADIKGLCHYRRYFSNDNHVNLIPLVYVNTKSIVKNSLSEEQIRKLFEENYEIILPMRYSPYPDTVEADLLNYCYKSDIETLKKIITEEYPDYNDDLLEVLSSRNMSYCNMFIARKDTYDNYCEWLFSVLKLIEERCDITEYDTQHKRIYGYLAEVLLNVYVRHNKLRCCYYKTAIVKSTDRLSDRLFFRVLVVRSHIHKWLYNCGCYGIVLLFAKLFSKGRFNRLKDYPVD